MIVLISISCFIFLLYHFNDFRFCSDAPERLALLNLMLSGVWNNDALFKMENNTKLWIEMISVDLSAKNNFL